MTDNPNTLSERYERLQEENRELRKDLEEAIQILKKQVDYILSLPKRHRSGIKLARIEMFLSKFGIERKETSENK